MPQLNMSMSISSSKPQKLWMRMNNFDPVNSHFNKNGIFLGPHSLTIIDYIWCMNPSLHLLWNTNVQYPLFTSQALETMSKVIWTSTKQKYALFPHSWRSSLYGSMSEYLVQNGISFPKTSFPMIQVML